MPEIIASNLHDVSEGVVIRNIWQILGHPFHATLTVANTITSGNQFDKAA